MTPRIVIDTNIFISAIFWGGKPREVVDLGRSGRISVFTSMEIQEELERKLKSKFGLDDQEVSQILFDFSLFTLPVEPSCKITIIDDDPDDNKFVECAVASKATHVVSGDKHLLNLKEYMGIQIKKAAEFLAILEQNKL
ncbi:MAG: putative toxin-antitoxin system toxin component, PIN family [Deltaproteobacteria bacterium]|nr:putative toxin-antitoxin system toxin component, PIN family [Deltaproteobacteria bacterium]